MCLALIKAMSRNFWGLKYAENRRNFSEHWTKLLIRFTSIWHSLHDNARNIFTDWRWNLKITKRRNASRTKGSTNLLADIKIRFRIIDMTSAWHSISTCSTHFLIIGLNVFWSTVMNHLPHIWLVNAHTKCHSGNHNLSRKTITEIWLALNIKLAWFGNLIHLNHLEDVNQHPQFSWLLRVYYATCCFTTRSCWVT